MLVCVCVVHLHHHLDDDDDDDDAGWVGSVRFGSVLGKGGICGDRRSVELSLALWLPSPWRAIRD